MDKESKQKILVADDSPEIREIVAILLGGEGYEVIEAVNGQEAIDLVTEDIDLIILDVMMPIKSGISACVEIRKKTIAPILFLTAKTQDSDKTIGFSAGADDYLSKPFSTAELVSRVKSLIRRYLVYQGKHVVQKEGSLELRGLKVDEKSKNVLLDGKLVILTDIEFNLLLLMIKNQGKIFSAENLYESIWNEPYFYSANNTVMVHIRNLRKKIERDPQNPEYIKTVWGKGYCIE